MQRLKQAVLVGELPHLRFRKLQAQKGLAHIAAHGGPVHVEAPLGQGDAGLRGLRLPAVHGGEVDGLHHARRPPLARGRGKQKVWVGGRKAAALQGALLRDFLRRLAQARVPAQGLLLGAIQAHHDLLRARRPGRQQQQQQEPGQAMENGKVIHRHWLGRLSPPPAAASGGERYTGAARTRTTSS